MNFIERNDQFSENLMLADDQGNRITYGEFEKIYEERSKFLEEGRLAFLYCRNTVGAVLYYRSCLRNHVVPLLLEHRMDRELLRTLIGTYEPDYLIGMPEDLTGTDGTVLEGSECFGYQLAKRDAKRKTGLNPELALLLTTSGSTGSPKLVRQSRKNVTSNAESIAEYLELDPTERPITTLPMNYTYGLSIMNSHFQVGAAVLLTEHTLFEREFWDFSGSREQLPLAASLTPIRS
ncbi:MAG: AMP-binding protein [Clostridium fessum]